MRIHERFQDIFNVLNRIPDAKPEAVWSNKTLTPETLLMLRTKLVELERDVLDELLCK